MNFSCDGGFVPQVSVSRLSQVDSTIASSGGVFHKHAECKHQVETHLDSH